MSEKDSRPAEPEPYLYQSLPRAYEQNGGATQWPSLLSGVLDSVAAMARGSARQCGGELLYFVLYKSINGVSELLVRDIVFKDNGEEFGDEFDSAFGACFKENTFEMSFNGMLCDEKSICDLFSRFSFKGFASNVNFAFGEIKVLFIHNVLHKYINIKA